MTTTAEQIELPWEGRVYLGCWRAAAATTEIVEPATGGILGRIGRVGPDDVSASASAAAAAQPAWELAHFDQRATVLGEVARLIEKRFGFLADWISARWAPRA